MAFLITDTKAIPPTSIPPRPPYITPCSHSLPLLPLFIYTPSAFLPFPSSYPFSLLQSPSSPSHYPLLLPFHFLNLSYPYPAPHNPSHLPLSPFPHFLLPLPPPTTFSPSHSHHLLLSSSLPPASPDKFPSRNYDASPCHDGGSDGSDANGAIYFATGDASNSASPRQGIMRHGSQGDSYTVGAMLRPSCTDKLFCTAESLDMISFTYMKAEAKLVSI